MWMQSGEIKEVNTGGSGIQNVQEQCSHSNVALTFLSDLKLHSLGVWVGVGPVLGQQPGFPVFHSTADEYNDGLWLC